MFLYLHYNIVINLFYIGFQMATNNALVLENFKQKNETEQRETLVETLMPIQNDAPVYLRMLKIAQDPNT